MIVQLVLLLAGLGLIVFGADWLVDGASAIARKVGISEFVIGLTIVGFGTSCPELVVSLTGAIAGNADVSIGNVVGSNIFNTLLILGLTALVLPIGITTDNKRRDIPLTLLVTFLLIALGMGKVLAGVSDVDGISRVEGAVFLVLFAAYMYMCFKFDKGAEDNGEDAKAISSIWLAILLVAAGLCGLIFGGRLFVNSATAVARMLGVSDKFIAITVLAGGTSLPELATCVVAAAKKKGQLALGNILGSNVFNILLILGCSAVVSPISFAAMDLIDMLVLFGSAVLVWMSSYTFKKDRIDRCEGAIFVLCFIGYYVYLVSQL
ncbi:MAG: calcium/sodium antiporter [Bacteroidales bacterium]|nr:calcium/sodium antiporter [Candidatus Cryptobacteroides choladohippi]MCQ2178915.1 calcium/sodium antiporter [Bacteroidales bacterium]